MSKRFRIIGLCLLAMFAFSAVMASAASAKVAWWWKNPTTGVTEVLPVGTTLTVTATAATSFYLQVEPEPILKTPRMSIVCNKISIVGGTAFNETGPTGKDKGKIKFEECTNDENCTNPFATVETVGNESELGTELKGPNVGRAVDIFRSGANNVFAKVRCNGIESNVTGVVYAGEWENVTTPALTHSLIFPTRNTKAPWCLKPIVEEVENWKKEIFKPSLKVFSAEALFCGTATVSMKTAGGTAVEWDVR